MQAVKASNSELEIKLGKVLWKANLRYRRHYKKLPGKPDFVLVRHRIAIFCDSHFWHGYKWEQKRLNHKSNKEFWYNKIQRNIERDKEVNEMLTEMGWKVIRFWEHEIKEDEMACVAKIKEKIDNR